MSSSENKPVPSNQSNSNPGTRSVSGNDELGKAFVLLERVDEKMEQDRQTGTDRKKQLKMVASKKSGARQQTSVMATREETLRDVKKDMSDKWSEMVSLMTKYEVYLREMDGGKGKTTETDAVRLRVENEEMKIKIKVIESKWKSFKDEAIKNEVKLQRRIKQLESGNQRLKESLEKMKQVKPTKSPAPKRKREQEPSDYEEEDEDEDEDEETENAHDEKFGNVRVVSDPKRLKFHQDAIINGKRQRKPKFSHLKDDYAIDMKGMDRKMLDADEDVAGVGGQDEGEGSGGDDDEEENWCTECNKNFVNAKGLRRHLKDMHGVLNPDATFSCDKCNILLASAVAYNRHMKYLHGQDEKPFTCDVCHVAFATQQNLQSHIENKVHEKKGIAKQQKDDVKRVTAAMKDEDGKETTVMVSVVKASPNTSVAAKAAHKRNICPLCFMVFPTSTAMTDHMKKHKQTKGGATYPCEHCDEIFYKKTSLVEHEARCPKNKSYDDKLWETIVFPEASQVLEEQANYKDESLIDPELGPTADLQEAVAPAGTITMDEPRASDATNADSLVMDTAEGNAAAESQQQQQQQQQEQPQYETVSIVDESGQPLGQAQVSVDPVTGAVTYVALGQNGEPLPLSQALEGNETSELLLSIINQANAKAN